MILCASIRKKRMKTYDRKHFEDQRSTEFWRPLRRACEAIYKAAPQVLTVLKVLL